MRADRRDGGFSLAEVLVAMTLTGLIGTVVATVAILVLRTSAGVEERLENTTQGELGIAAAGKVLRTAVLPEQLEDTTCIGCADTAIVVATATQIQFYANLGDTTIGPSLVTLCVVEDVHHRGTAVLRQKTVPAERVGVDGYRFADVDPTCRTRDRVLARGLLWPSPGVFGYFDYEGQWIRSAQLGPADRPRVSSIDVTLAVQQHPGHERFPPRTALSRVRLPNVEINVLEES